MTVLMVPEMDLEPYPTLGPAVVSFIESFLVFGPGDKLGEPARVDAEKRALIYRMYEIYPPEHANAGRRRFRRVCLSLVKGSAKTEFAAWIAACELHPDAPVRCYDWDGHGNPLGRGVTDPYIPMMAYTEEQTEELAYGALKTILEHSPLADDFDIGLARIMRKDGAGKAEAVAGSPNAVDGARTTHSHHDETHRYVLPKLKQAHGIMLRNLVKRREADPWALETTTSFAPGEGSVAESTMDYAMAIKEGRVKGEPRLFFFHRQAADSYDLEDPAQRRAAVVEAAGPIVSQWLNVDAIVESWEETDADKPYLERVHTNRLVQASNKAFDAILWRSLAQPDYRPPEHAFITIGFDGSRRWDATGLVATEIPTGYQWVLGVWQRPPNLPKDTDWGVPEMEVHAAVDAAFTRYEVWRMYADPPYWESAVAAWSAKYGEERVIPWSTNRWSQMFKALRAYQNAMTEGQLSHDGHPVYAAHLGAACRLLLNTLDDQRERIWVIQKERKDSVHKIDLAMAGCLSWEARRDAIAAGAQPSGPSVYENRGILVFGS